MYKIYINESVLLLAQSAQVELDDFSLVVPYMGKSKSLLQLIDRLEKAPEPTQIACTSTNVDQLWHDFQGLYKVIVAAGGLILDDRKRMLLIFRRGFWDLPKGKVDAGESVEEAAIREVWEEVGLSVSIGRKLPSTWHTYRTSKGKRVLKHTHWYEMKSEKGELKLQHEEDIEAAKWVSEEAYLRESCTPCYRSIDDLIKACLASETTG